MVGNAGSSWRTFSTRYSIPEIQRGLRLLGLSRDDFLAILRGPSLSEARALLEEVQATSKKNFRKAALLLHPDRTDDVEKHHLFDLIKEMNEEVQKARVHSENLVLGSSPYAELDFGSCTRPGP